MNERYSGHGKTSIHKYVNDPIASFGEVRKYIGLEMSNFLPSIETFAKVSPLPGWSLHCLQFNLRDRALLPRPRRWVQSVRSYFCQALPLNVSMPSFNLGASLLWYGQNYLIYPSAFPPGSRTGSVVFSPKISLIIMCIQL